MASLDSLKRLFEHMAWADERVLRGTTTETAALELLAHVLGAELVWLGRILGAEPDAEVWPAAQAESCAELFARSRRGYGNLLAGLDEAGLARRVAYENSAGRAFQTSVEDILLHVALHGSYHRGQVALRAKEAGGEPVPSDYIAWVRGAPAATRDDARS